MRRSTNEIYQIVVVVWLTVSVGSVAVELAERIFDKDLV